MNVEIDCVLQNKKKMMKEWFFLEGKGESSGKNSFISFFVVGALFGGSCFGLDKILAF